MGKLDLSIIEKQMEEKYPIKVILGDKNWDFSGKESAQICKCIPLINEMVQDRIQNDPDNEEPVEIPLEENAAFSDKTIDDLFEYYKLNNYEKKTYGRVTSNV